MRKFKTPRILYRFIKKRSDRKYREKRKQKKIRLYRLKMFLLEKRLAKTTNYIEAPEILSLSPINYDKDNDTTEHTLFLQFKNTLEINAEKASKNNKKLFISFAKTRCLYADACILLIATIETIKVTYPNLRFGVKRPDKKFHHHKPQKYKYTAFNVDGVFCHIGLYRLLGFNFCNNTKHKNVQSWHYVFSDSANGDVTEPIFNELEQMGLQNLGDLYRGVIESIANAVEHAYNDKIVSNRQFSLKRWWMLVAKIDNKLMLYVCDLGHGIPNTLRFNKEPSLLQAVFNKLKSLSSMSRDCVDIKASTLIRETRTELNYRGKGGQDIKTFIENTRNSSITIHSNKGCYRYENRHKKGEILYDNHLSMNGTLLHWMIDVEE